MPKRQVLPHLLKGDQMDGYRDADVVHMWKADTSPTSSAQALLTTQTMASLLGRCMEIGMGFCRGWIIL